MTLEEAAEEILKGPFTLCIHCKGDGTVKLDKTTGTVCRRCKGHGRWRRGDYVQACVLLNVEPQELPTSKSLFGSVLASDAIAKKNDRWATANLIDYPRLLHSEYQREYLGEWSTNED